MASSRRRAFWGWVLLCFGLVLVLDRLAPQLLTWSLLLTAVGAALFYRGVRRDRGAIFPGTFLFLLGLFFFLQHQDLLDFAWWQSWPMIVLLAGISFIVHYLFDLGRRSSLMSGVVLIILGFVFLRYPDAWDEIFYQAEKWWPVIFILIGLRLIWNARGKAHRHVITGAPKETSGEESPRGEAR